MKRILTLLAAFTVVLGSGFVHGLWTSRWQVSPALEQAAARLVTVPWTAGDWKATPLPTDAELFQQAGAVSYWARRYQRRDEAVTVILMCGPAGKMSVHTPQVCYQGAGYELLGTASRHMIEPAGLPSAEFFSAQFRKPLPAGNSTLRIDWAWNAAGAWQAPDSPRWTFRGEAFLYKLYLVREITAPDNEKDEPNLDLLRQLVPVLHHALFGPVRSEHSS